jgi:uncharacterized protein YxjI
MSLRCRFDISDAAGMPRYQAEGTIVRFPKRFTISTPTGVPVAQVTGRLAWLPTFDVTIGGVVVARIVKQLTLFRQRWSIHGTGITVVGDVWSMNFELHRGGYILGRVNKQWISLRDRYDIEITNPADELLVLGIVLAIDYAKAQTSSASS